MLLLVGAQPAVAVAGAPAVDGPVGEAGAAETASATIAVDTVLSLTPEQPGSVGVVQTFDTPDEVTELRVTLDSRSTVTAAEGFSNLEGDTWEWDGETAEPRLRYELAVNRTSDRAGPMASGGSYLYTDVGEWALIQQPNVGFEWRTTGSVSVERTTRVDGAGAVGGATAFLGPHEEYTREVAGQEIRLIVPDDADLADPPERILDGLGNASRELNVGDRDATVFAVAAPTGRVDWAVQGVQVGDTDFWAQANRPIDAVGSTWLHEYVHTRQSFRTSESGRWITEATATWYAALLSHQQEGVGFAALSEYLERGTRSPQAGSVLADPSDWANNAHYWKGALVSGELDRRLRLATDGGATLQRVLASLNDHSTVTNGDVLAAVAEAGTPSTRDAAERLTTTSDAPDVWDREAHRDAFGGDAALLRVGFDPATDLRATDPYRNATTPAPVTLAAGERLSVRTVVENLGGATGEYVVTLRVDDAAVAAANGTLAPDGRTAVSLVHRFTETGRYTATVAGERFTVTVRQPASPSVTDLTVEPATVEPGGEVTVTATVTNDESVPGNATVAFTRDGETVTTRTVSVGPDGRETVTATIELSEAGQRSVGAGGQAVAVRVASPSETSAPGFGAPAAVAAIAGALGLRRLRSSR
ncbi:hypothetical protein [Halolamina pelagica]|uniref:hypothetical protein n=1 Tax=Halolamina pelagica TaxID=699431 RepID=UPI0015A6651A|nr:hypothetical protein [Halolamina pelagica]NHX37198.1 hypothetical protein [Halolamina sp. R1-12]